MFIISVCLVIVIHVTRKVTNSEAKFFDFGSSWPKNGIPGTKHVQNWYKLWFWRHSGGHVLVRELKTGKSGHPRLHSAKKTNICITTEPVLPSKTPRNHLEMFELGTSAL